MRRFLLCLTSFGLASSALAAEPLRVEDAVAEALANNPRIHAAQARWDAAKARVPQSWALPDPTVSYMVMGEMLETPLGPQEDVYEAEQMIPFPGKLWQRKQMALAESQAEYARMRATERDVAQDVLDVYGTLYATDTALVAVEEVRQTLQSFAAIAEARYAGQGGAQRDVAKAQVELSEAIERLFVLRQQRQAAAARLNSLLNRDPRTSIDQVATPALPVLERSLDELLAVADQQRPEIAEAKAERARSLHAKRLAGLEYVPDLSIGFQYTKIGGGTTTMADDGRDAWMVPLRINVPLWQNRLIPQLVEAKRQLQASESAMRQAQNSAAAEVRDAYYRFTASSQIAQLYRDALVPQAELAFRADGASYEAGRADILNLLDSERAYLNAKITEAQALGEAVRSFGILERAVGADLGTIETIRMQAVTGGQS